MTHRYVLRDDQWERLKDFLPGQPGYVGANSKDNRLFVETVLFRYRAGIPWRDLPVDPSQEKGQEKRRDQGVRVFCFLNLLDCQSKSNR